MLDNRWNQIYEMFMDRVEEIHVTEVQTNKSGDVFSSQSGIDHCGANS